MLCDFKFYSVFQIFFKQASQNFYHYQPVPLAFQHPILFIPTNLKTFLTKTLSSALIFLTCFPVFLQSKYTESNRSLHNYLPSAASCHCREKCEMFFFYKNLQTSKNIKLTEHEMCTVGASRLTKTLTALVLGEINGMFCTNYFKRLTIHDRRNLMI